jgi:hypothetical protein
MKTVAYFSGVALLLAAYSLSMGEVGMAILMGLVAVIIFVVGHSETKE